MCAAVTCDCELEVQSQTPWSGNNEMLSKGSDCHKVNIRQKRVHFQMMKSGRKRENESVKSTIVEAERDKEKDG